MLTNEIVVEIRDCECLYGRRLGEKYGVAVREWRPKVEIRTKRSRVWKEILNVKDRKILNL